MRYSLAALCLLPTLAFAQQLHTFKNGEVADADKLNESLQYILNNASGGCSAKQLDQSAVIECSDGSTAAVASVGRVVIVPEGEQGYVPDVTDINTGQIYIVDANDVVLGLWDNGPADEIYFRMTTNDGVREFAIYNDTATEQVRFVRNFEVRWLFAERDCTGDIWFGDSSLTLATDPRNGNDLVTYFDPDGLQEDPPSRYPLTLTSIWQSTWSYDDDTCVNGQFPDNATLAIPYIFPDEILNAAYPIGVKQF
jgi:hypothetical protein